MPRRRLVLGAGALLLAACTRGKDPYERHKPGQLLDEGERLLRRGDLAGAEKAFRLGLERAESAGAREARTRAFIRHLFFLAVKRDDAGEAERLFARLGAPVDVRAAIDTAVMIHRQGKLDAARARLEAAIPTLTGPAPALPHDRAIHAAAWMTLDRLRTARFDRAAAQDAAQGVIESLAALAEPRAGFEPLPSGLRPWISRYIDHLQATDRGLVAKDVAAIVERIDENAPPPEPEALCLSHYVEWQNLGCVLEIER